QGRKGSWGSCRLGGPFHVEQRCGAPSMPNSAAPPFHVEQPATQSTIVRRCRRVLESARPRRTSITDERGSEPHGKESPPGPWTGCPAQRARGRFGVP